MEPKLFQHSIIIAFSLAGFFTHLFIITRQYLQFEIESVIETNFAENIVIIPDLSLCNYMIDLLDEERLQETDFKDLLNDEERNSSLKDLIGENEEIYRLFEERFDTYAIMNELILPAKQIITDIRYLKNNDSFLGLDHFPRCNVSVYGQKHDICFSVQCPYGGLPRKKHNVYSDRGTLLKSANKNVVLEMELNQTLLDQIKSPFQIFIFETGLKFTFKASTLTSISLLNDLPRSYDMTYQRFRNIRLPLPYTSECEDYFETGFFSRNHKLEHCINLETRQQHELQNRTFFGNVAYSDERGLHFDIYRQNLNQKARAEIEPILNGIFDKCAKESEKKECYSQKFTPYMLKQRILANDSECSTVRLLASTLPEIKNTAKPKFTLVNLLLFYGSTLSLWFGLTIIRVAYYLHDAVCSARGKLRSLRTARQRRKAALKVKDSLIRMRKNRVLNGRLSIRIDDLKSLPVELPACSVPGDTPAVIPMEVENHSGG